MENLPFTVDPIRVQGLDPVPVTGSRAYIHESAFAAPDDLKALPYDQQGCRARGADGAIGVFQYLCTRWGNGDIERETRPHVISTPYAWKRAR
jgi:hypothetical protein